MQELVVQQIRFANSLLYRITVVCGGMQSRPETNRQVAVLPVDSRFPLEQPRFADELLVHLAVEAEVALDLGDLCIEGLERLVPVVAGFLGDLGDEAGDQARILVEMDVRTLGEAVDSLLVDELPGRIDGGPIGLLEAVPSGREVHG